MQLSEYDLIVINTSGGKDSQVTLDKVYNQAQKENVTDRLVAVHADLGRVEWAGTKGLAMRQTEHYGIRFEWIKRPQGDLLEHVLKRGMWPSSTTRYCTSDHKRGQCGKVIVKLTNEIRDRFPGKQVRILNIFGFRAEESPARAKVPVFQENKRLTNSKRIVHDWLPIHHLNEDEVWKAIKASGVEHHSAYDLGMPRLSCVFCIFAPRPVLILAGHHNQKLLDEYVAVEKEINHTFRQELPISEIKAAVLRGEGIDMESMNGAWNM